MREFETDDGQQPPDEPEQAQTQIVQPAAPLWPTVAVKTLKEAAPPATYRCLNSPASGQRATLTRSRARWRRRKG